MTDWLIAAAGWAESDYEITPLEWIMMWVAGLLGFGFLAILVIAIGVTFVRGLMEFFGNKKSHIK